MESTPLISIVIPVKNGIATIGRCLDAIYTQSLIDRCEVIVIDSGSNDGTLDVVKQYPVRLFQIPPEAFNHGGTRNYGVSLANGEFVVMTVQDASATDNRWLEHLVRHFDDSEVDAVCGGQMVPHHGDKNPLQWFRPFSSPRVEKVIFSPAHQYLKLSPGEKRTFCSLDDVNCAYRKKALLERPFRQVSYGEDMMWAHDTLSVGRAIVYDMNARVAHYHHQSASYCYKNTLTHLFFVLRFFDLVVMPSCGLKEYLLVPVRLMRVRLTPYWVFYNWRLIFFRNKAEADFYRAYKKGDVERFFQNAVTSIPQGVQKKVSGAAK